MKNKITRIWGISLIVVLLASMLVATAPTFAKDNTWEAEITPGPPTYQLPVASTDVTDLDVTMDGSTIWAATGTDNYTYKSTNGGETWTQVKGDSDSTYAHLISVAPDDGSKAVVCDTTNNELFVTTNGGTTWDQLPATIAGAGASVSANIVMDMEMSTTIRGKNYIAVAGNDTDGAGNAWFFDLGSAAPIWYEMADRAGYASTNNGETTYIGAVAFSPNFPSDEVLVAVTANTSDTTGVVMLEAFSFAGADPDRKWNSSAALGTNFPVTLCDGNYTTLTAASIALDPEYLGSDDILMNAFVGLTLTGTDDDESGIYRTKYTEPTTLKANVNIYSVAYDGTTLAAGVYSGSAGAASTTVWRSSDPMSSIPTFTPSSTLKSPSGTGEVIVAWAGTDLVAGTSGDESAFSVSTNDGKSFSDLSLIDTAVTNASDVAVVPDGSAIYWVTNDGDNDSAGSANNTDLSVWRLATRWERVLSVRLDNASSNYKEYVVSVAPDDPDVVYVAQKGGTTVYYSKDGGTDKWYTRNCTIPPPFIQDFGVESADVAYALSGGGDVLKTTNSGFTWGPPTNTKHTTGFSLTVVSEDTLLVGTAAGAVSYSMDGNRTWTEITKKVEVSTDDVMVVADTDFANNNTIYAVRQTTGVNFMRYVIGESSEWEDMYGGLAPGVDVLSATETPYGLATINGALYAVVFDTSSNQTALYQNLVPTKSTLTTPDWAKKATTTTTDTTDRWVALGILSSSPNALAASAGSNKLWVSKNTVGAYVANKLYSYTDVLAAAGPTLVSPADEYSDPVNTVTGFANEIAFSWQRLSNAIAWQLGIYYDETCREKVTSHSVSGPGADAPTVVVPIGPDRDSTDKVNFMPGTTYYWRVKATNPLYSPYSEVRSFTVQPGVAMVPTIGSPANGASIASVNPAFSWSPVAGASEYEFQLAAGTNFAAPLFSSKLAETGIRPTVQFDAGMTYFWRVRATSPVIGDWSTIANFTVAEPAGAAPPPVVVQQVPAPQINIPAAPPATVIQLPEEPAPPAQIAPAYIWAIIIIGAVLVIAVLS